MNSRRSFIKSAAVLGSTAFVANLSRAIPESSENADATDDFWTVVHTRRSVRRFRPDAPVSEEHVARILNAARMSPTSGNQQPWKFLVVRSPAKIAELKGACIANSLAYFEHNRKRIELTREEFAATTKVSYDGYFSAPVYVVVLTDNQSQYSGYNHYDGPLAAMTLLLAARALGYGTVFLTDSIPASVCKSVLNIPDHYTQVCVTPIGVPTEWPITPQKKPIEDFIAYDSF